MDQSFVSADRKKILAHIATLASAPFEGRCPGTIGETMTVNYLREQCLALGLTVHEQAVPVLGICSQAQLQYCGPFNKEPVACRFGDDFVAMSRQDKEDTALAAIAGELVFVGYGIDAPEYGWNDFKSDVRGKTLLILAGEPSRLNDRGEPDASFFGGRAMTYYGRWTYKFEIASKMGARAAFIIHDSEAAGYGFDVVKASWGTENFNLDQRENRVEVEGWLSAGCADSLLAANGLNLADIKKQAQEFDFENIVLPGQLNITVKNKLRRFRSTNVIATIEGNDMRLKDECVIYSAHWDHFGSKEIPGKAEKEIFSGALDNASGVAVLLEIARILKETKPARSILFLFTTLEEFGLLGSRYYTENPLFALESTTCVINLDIMNPWGRTRKFVSITRGHSSLDEILEEQAARQHRQVMGDPEPEKGYFFRSDHIEFMRRGVPALFFLNPGFDYLNHSPQFAEEKRREYLQCDYHKITDKVKPDWDLSGMEEDCMLLAAVGRQVSEGNRPFWYEKVPALLPGARAL